MPLDLPITTYSDTTPQRQVITDVIAMIDPSDAPAVEAIGGLDGAASRFSFTAVGTKMEWLEDTLPPLTSNLAMAASVGTGATAVTLTATDASLLQPGHLLLFTTGEIVYVSDVAISTNIITVTRAFNSVNGSLVSTEIAFEIVGMARMEADESDPLAATDRTSNHNYTDILHQEVRVSGTLGVIPQYGIPDEEEYQSSRVLPNLMRILDKQLYYGVRAQGSATTPRSMGGFSTFITDNLYEGSSLTKAKFEALAQMMYTDGGSGDWIALLSPGNVAKVQAFYENTGYLWIERGETTVGMPPAKKVLTAFGEVTLVMDRWAPSTKIYMLDRQHVGMKTLRPFAVEPLAKTGDYDKKQVIGEFSLCVRLDKAHGILTAVS
mgnify:FL=1